MSTLSSLSYLGTERLLAQVNFRPVRFPVSLDDAAVSAEVRRPGVLWSSREKEAQEEVLVLEGIETDGKGMIKFDVYINAMEHEKVKSGGREMAGSYMCLSLPRMDGTGKGMRIETSMRVALNELLKDLGADGDKSVTGLGSRSVIHMARRRQGARALHENCWFDGRGCGCPDPELM